MREVQRQHCRANKDKLLDLGAALGFFGTGVRSDRRVSVLCFEERDPLNGGFRPGRFRPLGFNPKRRG